MVIPVRGSLVDRNRPASAGNTIFRLKEKIGPLYCDSTTPCAGTEKSFYAACIPCLSRDVLMNQTVCGKGWALLGDAAGFADGITAEGIYYAFRSAELLCRILPERRTVDV